MIYTETSFDLSSFLTLKYGRTESAPISVSKKSMTFLHAEKRHIFCEAQASRKISLRSSKSLIAQAFLMAIIQFEEGLAPLKLPRCAVIFPQQHGFFDSLMGAPKVRPYKSTVGFTSCRRHRQRCNPRRSTPDRWRRCRLPAAGWGQSPVRPGLPELPRRACRIRRSAPWWRS